MQLSQTELHHHVEFVFDDEGFCEATKGIEAARRMFAQHINILIVGCVATTKALAAESDERGVLIFSAGLLDRESSKGGPLLVNFATEVGTEAAYQANYIHNAGYKTVAIIRPQEPFGEELSSVLRSELESRGIKLLFDDSDAATTNDFGSAVLKIVRKKPDVVVMNLGESQQQAFVKKLRESGSSIPIVSTYGLESNNTSSENAKFLEGITYSYPYNEDAQSEQKIAFDRDFSKKFGSEIPNANAYFVHDGLLFLDRALDECAANDSRCIFRYFAKLGTVKGISGTMTFRPDGSTDRPYKMKRVVKGKFVWLE